VFGDLADALAEAYPAIAPEVAAFEAGGVTPDGATDAAPAATGEADGDGDDDDDDDDGEEGKAKGTGEGNARR